MKIEKNAKNAKFLLNKMESCYQGLKCALSGRLEIHPCVLQDIGPFGLLPCSHSIFSAVPSKQGIGYCWTCAILGWLVWPVFDLFVEKVLCINDLLDKNADYRHFSTFLACFCPVITPVTIIVKSFQSVQLTLFWKDRVRLSKKFSVTMIFGQRPQRAGVL